jgi:Uma2 family endonuclease
MSAVAREPYLTAEEYLAIERRAETRSELIDGRMYAMAGASREHNLAAGNVFAGLHQRLRGSPCETYKVDTLLNPLVIVEVLSESTESYDRGAEFEHYQRLSSLQEYVLVAQDRVRIDHYLRQGEQWLLTTSSDIDGVLRFPTLDCAIPLREVYDRVEFPAAESAPESGRAPE